MSQSDFIRKALINNLLAAKGSFSGGKYIVKKEELKDFLIFTIRESRTVITTSQDHFIKGPLELIQELIKVTDEDSPEKETSETVLIGGELINLNFKVVRK